MLTKMFALLHRGLRHDARLLKVHLMRLGMVVIVVFLLFFAQIQAMTVGSPGLTFFGQITWITFAFATLACSTLYATAITEEKEEQTLGLLALANISPLSLILGKFFPRLVGALLLLSVLFPFTLLSITLGGVTWGQVWGAYWTLFAHVVLIGAMGLLCSVLFRSSRVAVRMTLFCVAGFLVLPAVVDSALSSLMTARFVPAMGPLQELSAAAINTSAVPRIVDIMQTGFDEGAFGLQVLSNLLGAALLFFAAWALFLPFNRLNESDTETSSWFARGARLSRASRRCWRWPLAWKDFHYLVGGPAGWTVRAVLYLAIAFAVGFGINGFRLDGQLRVSVGHALMGTTAATAALELLLSASYLFPSEIRQSTLPSLVTLPGSIARIVYGKAVGACLGLVPAAVCFVIGGFLAAETVFNEMFDSNGLFNFLLMGCLPSFIWFVVLLHLVVLYSLLMNQWAAVPMAMLTMMIANCFMSWVMMFPWIIVASLDGGPFQLLAGLMLIAVIGIVAGGICFGLQVMIAQQLRALAAR